MGSPVLALLELSDAERAELISLAARRKTAHALALRARIVLTCSEGVHNNAEGAKRGSNRQTVGKWRRRFVEHCVDGLYDETWSGTPRTIDDAQLEAVIVRTLESLPPDAPHWSSRRMAKAVACRPPPYRASGAPFGLQPHRLATFKLTADPNFRGQVA